MDATAGGRVEPVLGPFGDLVTLLDAVAARYGDREAFVDGDERLTFAQWRRAADGVAALFHRHGVRQGDVVCLMLPSSIDYAICYQAALRLGAITSGVNTRFGPLEATSIIERLEPTVTVCDHGVVPPCPAGIVVERAELHDARALDPAPRAALRPDDVTCVVWTSGTTGQPKGAVFDHRRLEAVADGANVLAWPGDRRLSPLPFVHVGYMTRMWEELRQVITTIISPVPWSAATTLEIIERERVTVAQGVPTQWTMMLNHPRWDSTDFSSLRVCGSGASVVPPELVRELDRRLHLPIVIGYSSTEASIIANGVVDIDESENLHLVGNPWGGVELRVVDDTGAPLPSGEVGNVQCRSAAVMREYWKDPERTAEVLSPDGWLNLGDLGHLDEKGRISLVGRKKDMYIRGGYNVYPTEVEAILEQHPDVARVAVVGMPNPVLGELGVAFVVPAPGTTPDLAELRAWCKARIADYKAPDRLELCDDFPVNAMLKIDKAALLRSLGDTPPAQ